MSGVSVTQLFQSRGDKVEQRAIVRGYIANGRPAPTGFPEVGSQENLLWVVTPSYSLERIWGPCWWGAEHGATLPAHGNEVVVAFDDQGIPTVISWQGNHS